MPAYDPSTFLEVVEKDITDKLEAVESEAQVRHCFCRVFPTAFLVPLHCFAMTSFPCRQAKIDEQDLKMVELRASYTTLFDLHTGECATAGPFSASRCVSAAPIARLCVVSAVRS